MWLLFFVRKNNVHIFKIEYHNTVIELKNGSDMQ